MYVPASNLEIAFAPHQSWSGDVSFFSRSCSVHFVLPKPRPVRAHLRSCLHCPLRACLQHLTFSFSLSPSLFLYLSVFVTVCLCPCHCLHLHLSICECLFRCLCLSLSVWSACHCLYVCLSLYLSLSVSFFGYMYVTVCLFVCLSIPLSTILANRCVGKSARMKHWPR